MRIWRGSGIFAVALTAWVSSLAGCSSHDPVVLVTPYVAKAPQPPPAASQPAVGPAFVPATAAYEQAVIGK